MGIAFRCTGCRARLHVPNRRAGGSITCPRCETRVVVPQTSAETRSALESREVERSLATLDAPPRRSHRVAVVQRRLRQSGVTVPWWAIYAAIMAFVTAVIGAFVGGVWWASITGG